MQIWRAVSASTPVAAGWLGLMRVLEDHIRSDRKDAAEANPTEDA